MLTLCQENPKAKISASKPDRPKVYWVTDENDIEANAFGYATHNRYMRRFSKDLIDFDKNADIALHITSADKFEPIPNKFNVLFSMWEFLTLPKSYIEALEKADAIIVPSTFCETLFAKYTDKPIYKCFEGVDESTFTYYQRKPARYPKKFRFLWVGAPNPRKGYPTMLELADKVFQKSPLVEIYLKTSFPPADSWKTFWHSITHLPEILCDQRKRWSFFRFLTHLVKYRKTDMSIGVKRYGRYQNIIMDNRKLPIDELVDLYRSAHAFVLPSLGEGWGLTLIEAMATGCPAIAPSHTGMADFFDIKSGWPIRYSTQPVDLKNYDLLTEGYIPDTASTLENMVYVMEHYSEAIVKASRASKRIRNNFTWTKSALRMRDILNDITEKKYGFELTK